MPTVKPLEIERLTAERDEWKQAAQVEAGLRREFQAEIERIIQSGMRINAAIAIKERLRDPAWRRHTPAAAPTMREAADEIERLRAENAMLRDAILQSDDAHWTPAMRAALTTGERHD